MIKKTFFIISLITISALIISSGILSSINSSILMAAGFDENLRSSGIIAEITVKIFGPKDDITYYYYFDGIRFFMPMPDGKREFRGFNGLVSIDGTSECSWQDKHHYMHYKAKVYGGTSHQYALAPAFTLRLWPDPAAERLHYNFQAQIVRGKLQMTGYNYTISEAGSKGEGFPSCQIVPGAIYIGDFRAQEAIRKAREGGQGCVGYPPGGAAIFGHFKDLTDYSVPRGVTHIHDESEMDLDPGISKKYLPGKSKVCPAKIKVIWDIYLDKKTWLEHTSGSDSSSAFFCSQQTKIKTMTSGSKAFQAVQPLDFSEIKSSSAVSKNGGKEVDVYLSNGNYSAAEMSAGTIKKKNDFIAVLHFANGQNKVIPGTYLSAIDWGRPFCVKAEIKLFGGKEAKVESIGGKQGSARIIELSEEKICGTFDLKSGDNEDAKSQFSGEYNVKFEK